MRGISIWLDRIVDAGEPDTAAGRALLDERYAALRRQIPLLYLIGLANLAGLFFATSETIATFRNPVIPLLVLLVLRLAYWLKARQQVLPAARIAQELRKTFFYALAFSLSFCAWALYQLAHGHNLVVLFGSLAAVGCAYGLSSYAAAARLPLLLLGLPLATYLTLSGQPSHLPMGISLSLILLLILQLLRVHDESFERLVETRAGIAAARERAQRAERLATAETAKARKVADADP